MSRPVAVGAELRIIAVPDVPLIEPRDDLPGLVRDVIGAAGLGPEPGDVVVVASKLLSRAEDRFVDLDRVTPSDRARDLAATVEKDPRLVELILRESAAVSRAVPGVLITRSVLGHVAANAGIDRSNARPGDAAGDWVLLLPVDPDASARAIRAALGDAVGVVVTDTTGRPFRQGTAGLALGVAGVPTRLDHRGRADLHGRILEHTETALGDQIACAADLVAGQADEGRGVVIVRGLGLTLDDDARAADLHRDPDRDLYA